MSVELAEFAGESLARIRAERPRVHCLTNDVVMQFMADVLAALGACPSMTRDPADIGSFVSLSQGLLINLGTLDGQRRAAIPEAVRCADAASIPWVLDPVKVDHSDSRLAFARGLAQKRPAVIRANGAELAALGGGKEEDALESHVKSVAQQYRCIAAGTGAVDVVSSGQRTWQIEGGSPVFGSLIGSGCVSAAVVAAFVCVDHDTARATACALLLLAVASELAAGQAGGPGTFRPCLIDSLYTLTSEDLALAWGDR